MLATAKDEQITLARAARPTLHWRNEGCRLHGGARGRARDSLLSRPRRRYHLLDDRVTATDSGRREWHPSTTSTIIAGATSFRRRTSSFIPAGGARPSWGRVRRCLRARRHPDLLLHPGYPSPQS